MSDAPAAAGWHCENCGRLLTGGWCSGCGQRAVRIQHGVGHFVGEIFEYLSHADSRLWRTSGALGAHGLQSSLEHNLPRALFVMLPVFALFMMRVVYGQSPSRTKLKFGVLALVYAACAVATLAAAGLYSALTL